MIAHFGPTENAERERAWFAGVRSLELKAIGAYMQCANRDDRKLDPKLLLEESVASISAAMVKLERRIAGQPVADSEIEGDCLRAIGALHVVTFVDGFGKLKPASVAVSAPSRQRGVSWPAVIVVSLVCGLLGALVVFAVGGGA